MVYTYDEKSKQVKLVKVPKIHGDDAQLIEKAKVPKTFLANVMKMKLNIKRASWLSEVTFLFEQLSSFSCKKSKQVLLDSFEYLQKTHQWALCAIDALKEAIHYVEGEMIGY